MQLSKYNYAFIALLSCSMSYAAIPIENVSLSQNTTASLPTTATNNTASTTDNNAAPVNINWQLMQKSEKLEEEVRRLRGTIEEHENTIQQLKKDLENHYADLDQRLQLLQQKVDEQQQTQQPTTPPVATPPTTNTANTPPTPTTSKTNSTNQVAPNNTAENTTETKKTELTEKEAYTLALEAYKQGGAKKAIAPMQDFIKHYPKSIYTGNAHFWLAEFNLAVTPSNYTAAKKNYEIVAKQYPESDKASRALYQLYSIAKEVDHNSTLATTYKQLILTKYPKSKEAGYFKTN
ncbi:YbgF trimerization domain-containing protein [Acinetobacter rathckeae]|uniref:YbgF trimerization domain-containing protein n=1 Tax=Acinetobacter rathckeae TaxID=2605272 RepID=UPI0018A2F5B5|nr:YbgF trimerization domain-containing protein [Acinetobacter rathckeae]MBF7687173.1 tetratricopeptide repeat protein [Acinetobacter rathckeae]MBF7694474.1 tetratricopeptide repeat protein [Acinetobacter rathckeae]